MKKGIWNCIGLVWGFGGILWAGEPCKIVETVAPLPLVAEVDVAIVGGSIGAVAAAEAAAQAGARVFLAAPRPYLGEDMAGRLALRADPADSTRHPLYAQLFKIRTNGNTVANQTTPFAIKRALDDALFHAGVKFLTGTFASDVLTNAAGAVSGIVLANRNGRQAVKARVVIDASERGLIARAAGAKATPFPAGTYTFRRTIIAGEQPPASDTLRVKELLGLYPTVPVKVPKAPPHQPNQITGRTFICELQIPMRDGSDASFAEAEQIARDATFVPTQLDSANQLAFTPPDWIIGKASDRSPWESAAALNLGVFEPEGCPNLWVLGPLADVSREVAERLAQPGNSLEIGARIGAAAAAAAKARGGIGTVTLGGPTARGKAVATHEGRDPLPAYLSNATGTVTAGPRALPELAACDVVVVGAGTGGAPAAIAAARQGVKVLVCDYLHQLGGVETEGMIGLYCFGNRVGFTQEIDRGTAATGSVLSQSKAEWYRREIRRAGATLWCGVTVNGVIVEDNRVTGIILVMPSGQRGFVRCHTAIDATGNALLPALAGEETEFITADELALQGVGQTVRSFGTSYANNDVGFLDDTDTADICFFALRARMSMKGNEWDQSQAVDTRERRRLHGVFYVTPVDVMNTRTYPDTVVRTYSNFDTHGLTVHNEFFIDDPGHQGMWVNLPYRSFLPKHLDGLLVIGLGLSAHRDAMPILRMQPDVQNQGYAAGIASAMAIQKNTTVREIDVKALQRHLVDKGNLPPSVIGEKDSFPLPDAAFAAAIRTLPDAYQGLPVLLSDPARSIPLLQSALAAAAPAQKLVYAHLLALLGSPAGEDVLIAKLQASPWDKGWNYKGMGQFNRSVSMLDSYVIALGHAHSKKALPAILAKLEELDGQATFSHVRAVALALEAIGEASAAPALKALLDRPGMSGHAISFGSATKAFPAYPVFQNEPCDAERNKCLRELSLARALLNLGDCQKRGETILRAYATDPRGAYAKHAALVLAKKGKK